MLLSAPVNLCDALIVESFSREVSGHADDQSS